MNLGGKIKIGKLDRKITFQNFTSSRNDFGEETLIWADVLTTWSSVEYSTRGTKEKVEVERETAFNTVIFTIRQRASFSPSEKMKIVFDSSDYDIQSIQEIAESRKRFWVIVGRKTDGNDS